MPENIDKISEKTWSNIFFWFRNTYLGTCDDAIGTERKCVIVRPLPDYLHVPGDAFCRKISKLDACLAYVRKSNRETACSGNCEENWKMSENFRPENTRPNLVFGKRAHFRIPPRNPSNVEFFNSSFQNASVLESKVPLRLWPPSCYNRYESEKIPAYVKPICDRGRKLNEYRTRLLDLARYEFCRRQAAKIDTNCVVEIATWPLWAAALLVDTFTTAVVFTWLSKHSPCLYTSAGNELLTPRFSEDNDVQYFKNMSERGFRTNNNTRGDDE